MSYTRAQGLAVSILASGVINSLQQQGIGHYPPSHLELAFASDPPRYRATCESFINALSSLCTRHGFAFEPHREVLRDCLLERKAAATAAKTLLRMLATHIIASTGEPEAATAAITSLVADLQSVA